MMIPAFVMALSLSVPPLPAGLNSHCDSIGSNSPHYPAAYISELRYGKGRLYVAGYTVSYYFQKAPYHGAPLFLYIQLDESPALYSNLVPDNDEGKFEMVFDHLARGQHLLRMAVVSDEFGANSNSFEKLCFSIKS